MMKKEYLLIKLTRNVEFLMLDENICYDGASVQFCLVPRQNHSATYVCVK